MTSQLEKLAYEAKYTVGTYLDSLMSVPIWAGEKIIRGSKRLIGKEGSELTSDEIFKRSPIYRTRRRLRDSLDTRPGALYVRSNLLAAVPFLAIGMPAAELADKGIEDIIPYAPELGKCLVNSLITLSAQMITGYSSYVAFEVHANPQKYHGENGKLNTSRIAKTAWDTIKTFWKFDLTYITGKTALQTAYLMNGQDPWEASAVADGLVIPVWYSVAIPLGLRGGLIETNKTSEIYPQGSISDTPLK